MFKNSTLFCKHMQKLTKMQKNTQNVCAKQKNSSTEEKNSTDIIFSVCNFLHLLRWGVVFNFVTLSDRVGVVVFNSLMLEILSQSIV